MPADMTLAEFEREAAGVLPSAYALAPHSILARLRPLVLRLLAAERERCAKWHDSRADALASAAETTTANISYLETARLHRVAAATIRNMKDPT